MVSLWRALNVYIAIALWLTYALAIYATWFWRFRLAEAWVAVHRFTPEWRVRRPSSCFGRSPASARCCQQPRVLMPWAAPDSCVATPEDEPIRERALWLV